MSNDVALLLELASHLVKASHLFSSSSDHNSPSSSTCIGYLLDLFMPAHIGYTDLLTSSHFLAAAAAFEPDVMRLLVDLGADYNAVVSQPPTTPGVPFACALARLGLSDAIEQLLSRLDESDKRQQLDSSDLVCVDERGTNMLSHAARQGHVRTCKLILAKCRRPRDMITQTDTSGHCAFTHALKYNVSPTHRSILLTRE